MFGKARCLSLALAVLFWFGGAPAEAADPPSTDASAIGVPAQDWTYRFTPYGWFTSLNGNSTVKGRSAKVDASFVDIVDATLGQGGTLIGLMGDLEARNGPFSIYGNFVWTRLGVKRDDVRSRGVSPDIGGALGTAGNATLAMAILETGATYEIARFGTVGFDVLAGARYWYQRASLSFDLTATAAVDDLVFGRNVAIARSGAVDWFDGFVGARMRVTVAPGQELFLRGDVGGGGSRLSWQAIAAYGFDFAVKDGITYSGIIGYRALYADYAQGEGRRHYAFDMIIHGPVVGVSLRF